jgi:hypothetical protein
LEQDPRTTQQQGPAFELPPFSFGAVFRVGWGAFREHYPCLLVAGLVLLVFQVAFVLLGQLSLDIIGVDVISPVAGLLVGAPLSAGYIMLGVAAARGRRPRWQDMFHGFRRYWVIVALGIVVGAMVFAGTYAPLAMAVSLASLAEAPAVGFAAMVLLLGVLAVFAVGSRIFWAFPAALDHWGPRQGAMDVLRASWRMTAGPRWADVLAVVFLA